MCYLRPLSRYLAYGSSLDYPGVLGLSLTLRRYLAFGSSMDYMYSRLHVRYPLTFEVGYPGYPNPAAPLLPSVSVLTTSCLEIALSIALSRPTACLVPGV